MWLSHEYEYSKAAWIMTEWFLPKFTLITYWFCHLFNISILLRRPRPKLELKKFFSSGITGKTLRVILQCQSQWDRVRESRSSYAYKLTMEMQFVILCTLTFHFRIRRKEKLVRQAVGKWKMLPCWKMTAHEMKECKWKWKRHWEAMGGRSSSLDKYAESATALRLRRVKINTDPGGEGVPGYVLMTQQLKRKLY